MCCLMRATHANNNIFKLLLVLITESHMTRKNMLPPCGVSTAHRNGTIFGRTGDLTNVTSLASCEITNTEV